MQKIFIVLCACLACGLAEPANFIPAAAPLVTTPLAAAPLTAAYTAPVAAPLTAAYTAPAATFAGYNAPLIASPYALAPYTAAAPAVAAYTNAPLNSAFASQRLDIFNNLNLPYYAPAKLIAPLPGTAPARLIASPAAPARLFAPQFPTAVFTERYVAPAVATNVAPAPAKLIAPAANAIVV